MVTTSVQNERRAEKGSFGKHAGSGLDGRAANELSAHSLLAHARLSPLSRLIIAVIAVAGSAVVLTAGMLPGGLAEHFARLAGLSLVVGAVSVIGTVGRPSVARRLLTAAKKRPSSERPIVRNVQVDLESVLSGLVSLAESRDSHTGGHSHRVVEFSLAVGEQLGLESDRLEVLYWAALLHDVGKFSVPESILNKVGRLTDSELDEIRRHPIYGADLLLSLSPDLGDVAEVIRAHHERWDGRGYPVGMSGNEIPVAARIVAIADVFEALTSERPYRQPLSPPQALLYVRRGAGTQFDPDLVRLFERVCGSRVLPGGPCSGTTAQLAAVAKD